MPSHRPAVTLSRPERVGHTAPRRLGFTAVCPHIPEPSQRTSPLRSIENVITLACVGIFYTITFTLRRFRLNTKLGYVFLGIYSAYVIMVIVRYWILATPEDSDCV